MPLRRAASASPLPTMIAAAGHAEPFLTRFFALFCCAAFAIEFCH
jgi:hypothetical protein